MSCESTRRLRLLLTALVVVLAMLWIPALGHAAERDTVASTGLLERGSGYGTAGGSDAVRVVQRRLLRLGHEPGPIDGLYGPLTQGAVERFQQRHGLAVDGIVGRQTRRTLLPRRFEPTASRVERDTRPGPFARKSPAPNIGSESASEHPHARPLTAGAATRDGPVSGTSGVPPEAIAAVAALAGLLLFLTLRSQGEVRLNLGLTCAALLGVFGIGAVAGAVFATRAAPHGTDRATAQSGLLVAGNPAARSSRRSPSTVRWARPRRVKVPAQVAAAPARPATAPAPISPPPSPQTSLASPNAPAAPAAPPERVAKPRIRVQARLDGGARKVIRASPGGGAVAATDSSAP